MQIQNVLYTITKDNCEAIIYFSFLVNVFSCR